MSERQKARCKETGAMEKRGIEEDKEAAEEEQEEAEEDQKESKERDLTIQIRSEPGM